MTLRQQTVCTCSPALLERWGDHGNLCPMYRPCICTMGKHTRQHPDPSCPVHALFPPPTDDGSRCSVCGAVKK